MDSVIYNILKKKPIVDYLSKKGHEPFKVLSGGRLTYLCPFPDHNETKPSFMVWTQSEYQNFHCFGCQRGYNIINLFAGLENIPYKKAIYILGEGIDVSHQEDIKIAIELYDKRMSKDATKTEIAQKLHFIGTQCRYYLESVDLNPEETKIIDSFFSVIDENLLNLELDKIDDSFRDLNSILRLRKEKFNALQRSRALSAAQAT